MGGLADGTKGPEVASGNRLTLFWRRVKEHRIAQWTVGYVAVAYGIQHAVTLTSEAFKWPDAVLRISMLLLALGLPLAMTLAWYHGERARRVSAGELGIISILLAMASLMFFVFVKPAENVTRSAEASFVTASGPAGAALAVLPFANVSGDAGQEFFSDGMTDEIMTALAKIPALSVVARESAFTFKGKTQDVRAIGKALGARYLVEGSVRKAEDRVRITAQLVRADTGVSLWTEAYDRELKDVFAVQEDVARAIAASLRAPLGLAKGETLVPNRNIDPDAYQQYLLARSLFRSRSMDQAIPILESLVARDPDYAPASALLAYTDVVMPTFFSPALRTGSIEEARRDMQSWLERAETAGRRAVASDPKNALGYGALAAVALIREQWTESDDLLRKALALDPDDPESLFMYAEFLSVIGRIKDSGPVSQKLRMLEPFVGIYVFPYIVNGLELNGQAASSLRLLQALPPSDLSVGFYRVYLARVYAEVGRYKDAADALLLYAGNQVTRQSVEDAARLLRQAPANVSSPEALPRFDSELNFVYAYVGARDRLMEFAERSAAIGYLNPNAQYVLWYPSSAPVRKTERFRNYVRKIGLVDYWRARGWPDLCHPIGVDDFACE